MSEPFFSGNTHVLRKKPTWRRQVVEWYGMCERTWLPPGKEKKIYKEMAAKWRRFYVKIALVCYSISSRPQKGLGMGYGLIHQHTWWTALACGEMSLNIAQFWPYPRATCPIVHLKFLLLISSFYLRKFVYSGTFPLRSQAENEWQSYVICTY